MEKKIIIWTFLLCFILLNGNIVWASNKDDSQQVITNQIRFCESTYPYKGGILIANFGTEQLNPLNTEGKGYIVYYKNGNIDTLIPADGHLSAPKGMFEKEGYLFICDVNKIVIYNLNKLKEEPQTIRFPENDLFVNDLVAKENTLYASVTNTDKIYKIDISDLKKMESSIPQEWCKIPGPNGLLISDNKMYIASYPATGQTTDDNVIYQINDFQNPVPLKFINIPGQYDGIAMSADKKKLYITNWSPAGISSIDMKTRKLTTIHTGEKIVGAADITLDGNVLYIPDLPNSRVIIYNIK